jgi:hypothetical protein
MRNFVGKWSLICLALLMFLNIAQVRTVYSEENEVILEVGGIITTKRNGSEFLVFQVTGLFNTFSENDESNYPEQEVANIAILGVNFNLTGILDVNVLSIDGSPVSNLSILLENPLGTIILNATTDNDGKYSFKYLDQNETYQISLTYEGVQYFKEFSFTNESLAQLNFMVYETTRSDEDIIINSHQVIVQRGAGFFSVSEFLLYQNIGETVFNSSRLSIRLPLEMYGFSSSIMDCCILVEAGDVAFDPMDPIMPGQQYEMWMEYYIDADSSEYMFRKTVDYSTQAIHFFVETNEDYQAPIASKLENRGIVTIDNKEHTFFFGTDLEAGFNINVNVAGFSSPSNFITQIGGIILISLTTTFLVSYPIIRRRRVGKASVEDLEMKKLAIFRKTVQLDSDYASGDISQKKYDGLKSKYRKRAIRLMQRIDENKILQSHSKQSLSDQRLEEQVLNSTLQKLEEDLKKGLVSKEGYNKIKILYETRRIKVLEKIRKLEEKVNAGD